MLKKVKKWIKDHKGETILIGSVCLYAGKVWFNRKIEDAYDNGYNEGHLKGLDDSITEIYEATFKNGGKLHSTYHHHTTGRNLEIDATCLPYSH